MKFLKAISSVSLRKKSQMLPSKGSEGFLSRIADSLHMGSPEPNSSELSHENLVVAPKESRL